MPRDKKGAGTQDRQDAKSRTLTPAAERALKEAEERRARREQEHPPASGEVGGRSGPDPARYGDWEKNGIASDF